MSAGPPLPTPWSRFGPLVDGLVDLHQRAHNAASRSIDELLTVRNWLIGAWIIAYEQQGADRATYGDGLIDALAAEFKSRGLRGLGRSNLRSYRQLASIWPRLLTGTSPRNFAPHTAAEIRQTPSGELVPTLEAPTSTLSWQDDAWMQRLRQELSFSHLLELSRVSEPIARAFYELETLRHRWSVRELKRQRDSMLYERVGLSQDKEAVLALANEGRVTDRPATVVRDPYVLEFLGLSERPRWTEAELESALIDHLQSFLLELGGDFAFLGRQYRLTVGGRHHYIDLLFFHRRLRCLVAVDLKLGRFGYEDAGQMNFYLNVLRDQVSLEGEHPPVGLVLCAEKDAAEVHYATGGLDQQVFVSRYLTRLPSKEQLQAWLDEERALLAQQKRRT